MLAFGQMCDASGYAFCAVYQADFWTEFCLKFREQEREMRAGENNDVNGIAPRLIGQARDGAGDHALVNRLTAQFGLGSDDKCIAAMAQDDFVRSKARAEIVDIGLTHCCFGAKYADNPGAS